MAAKKKARPAARKSKKKQPARRAKRRVHVKAPRATAVPAGLKALDSEWRSFIEKSAPDAPLTEVWKAPKGTPSSKAAIRKATGGKKKRAARGKAPAARRKATKKKAAKK